MASIHVNRKTIAVGIPAWICRQNSPAIRGFLLAQISERADKVRVSTSVRKVGLDYVRAFAILCVLISHLLEIYWHLAQKIYPLGTVGVELFFVLSGYLIGGIFLSILAKGQDRLTPQTIFRFWCRRWLRTVPLYLIFLGVFALGEHMPHAMVARYLTFTQNLAWPMPAQFNVSWSLSVEEWFYLSLPAVTFIFGMMIRDGRRALLVAAAVMLIGPMILRLTVGPGKEWDSAIRKVVVMRLDAIMWGVLVAYLAKRHKIAFARLQNPLVLIAGVVIAAIAYGYLQVRWSTGALFTATRSDGMIFTVMDLGCALALPFFVDFKGFNRPIDSTILRISLWSYAMYLCHLPIIFFCGKLQHAHARHLPAIYLCVVVTAAVFAASAAICYLIEQPTMRLRDRLVPNHK